MDSMAQLIAKKIKALRLEKGYSQSAVAERLGVSLRSYQGWEKDFSSTVENLWHICRLYSIELSQFLAGLENRRSLLSASPREPGEGPILPDALDEYKYEVLERSFAGESPEKIVEALIRGDDLVPSDRTQDPEEFVDNCLRDLYHNDRGALERKRRPRSPEWEEQVAAAFSLPWEQCIVADTGHIRSQFLRESLLAPYGAEWLVRWNRDKPGLRLGVSNGFTLSKILDAVPRGAVRGLSLFPLNFTHNQVDFPISASSIISSFLYRNYGYQVTTDTLNEEQVYGAFLVCDAAMLGIGSFDKEGHYERMIRSVLGNSAVREVRGCGIIGDLNYHLLQADGSPADQGRIVSDIGRYETRSLVKAVSLKALRQKAERGGRVVLCASGAHKAAVLKRALREGYANHLLIDTSIAPLLLE